MLKCNSAHYEFIKNRRFKRFGNDNLKTNKASFINILYLTLITIKKIRYKTIVLSMDMQSIKGVPDYSKINQIHFKKDEL